MLEEFPLSVPGHTVISTAMRISLTNADLKLLEIETMKEMEPPVAPEGTNAGSGGQHA